MTISITVDMKKAEKRFDDVYKRAKSHKLAMNVVATESWKHVIQHFKDEEGKDGGWREWSEATKAQRRRGRGGTKILHDTGTLRQSIRFKSDKDEAHVYTKTNYAKYHEFEIGLPKRSFLWMSKPMINKLSKLFIRYISRGKK